MNKELLDELKKITPEEQKILDGASEIDKDIYMDAKSNVVDSKKLLESGKLIQIRTHTRYTRFPRHTHNYVELIYMCSGSTTHIINGDTITLKEGELLFLNQNATQEILPAGDNDIAVNFIIQPAFFDYTLQMMGDEENLIRDFIINCLRSKDDHISYLHFAVSDVLPIQNLMENLIWTIRNKHTNRRSINQITMGLLLLQLMNYTNHVNVGQNNQEKELLMVVLRYIEENYKMGELSELARLLHYDLHWLSRMIKHLTGKTYTELVQTKRMGQAAYLLQTTKLNINDIAESVGYENISYFHRLFQRTYGMSPRQYRVGENWYHTKQEHLQNINKLTDVNKDTFFE